MARIVGTHQCRSFQPRPFCFLLCYLHWFTNLCGDRNRFHVSLIQPSCFIILTQGGLICSYIFIVFTRFLGTPFFHSMLARSLSSSSDISVLIDPDTILMADLFSTLRYAHKLDQDWLLVASTFPFSLQSNDGIQKVCLFIIFWWEKQISC